LPAPVKTRLVLTLFPLGADALVVDQPLELWSAQNLVKRLKRIVPFVLPPALTVLMCGLLIRRSPLLFTLAFMVPVLVAVIAVIVFMVLVALRRD